MSGQNCRPLLLGTVGTSCGQHLLPAALTLLRPALLHFLPTTCHAYFLPLSGSNTVLHCRYGVVFKAKDKASQRVLALKQIRWAETLEEAL